MYLNQGSQEEKEKDEPAVGDKVEAIIGEAKKINLKNKTVIQSKNLRIENAWQLFRRVWTLKKSLTKNIAAGDGEGIDWEKKDKKDKKELKSERQEIRSSAD